jgi:hypothetical protein
MAATVRLRRDVLREMGAVKGWETDSAIATGLGVDRGNFSRVMSAEQGVGGRLIAAILTAFPKSTFERFFEIHDDNTVDEQVPA